jgi:DNA-binding SARP family transcriptional activator
MEFRLLGPLEVRDENRPLPLGGAKQRALLAVLLLNANEVVSRDRLVDELWGESPPETAVTSVQVYVSRLRKVLPPETLVTQAPGYALRADPEQVDVRRAERAADEARSELARGEPERASRLLADALGLWRGQPLAEFAYEPFAQAEIARLEELRLVLVEERIQADLALGRDAELAGELESLVRRYPLRERLRGHLMLALYRSGRQAEALEAYQDARRTLVDELGIDPGSQLQQLEKAMLNQDPALDLPEREPVTVTAKRDGPTLEPVPERKVVTILFGDLVGATELASAEDPERVRATMDRFYDGVAEEIELRGGTVETFIGDAVMAVFGAPSAQEDHAERALHAALAMRSQVEALFAGALALRVGINTGEIVLGEARKGGSFITGDAVNVAARLEEAAGPGEILAGERTAALARGAFELGEPRHIAAKGKEDPVVARPLTGSLALTRPRGIHSLSFRFVGRARELQQLSETYDRVAEAHEPQLVTIMADAGVGKTTLVSELVDQLASRASPPLRLIGRCLPFGRAITYRPLAEIVRQRLGILEADPPELALERLGPRRILGLALGLDTAGDLHPSTARDRLHETVVELLEEAAEEGPVVVVLEDLHWAEEPLLDVIERVVREVRGPLCLIGTGRLELLDRRASWGGGRKNASLLWLEPMTREESEEMLAELLAREVPSSLRDFVLERSEGNPFFLEELLAVLIDRGALRLEEGRWDLIEMPADLAVPDSIHSLVAARVDLLQPVEKAALQAASVIGRTSWAGAIRELVADGEPDLATLEERDFIRRRPDSTMPGEREYVFKHALTREVAYGSIAKARRATLHAGFAEWLESRGRARDEDASLLAHHYAEAVRPEYVDLAWRGQEERADELGKRAVAWLRRAAELAVGRFELDEALALIDQALELSDAPTQVELLRLAADAHRMRFEMGAFREALERALAHDPPKTVAAEIYSELAGRGVAPYMWKQAPSPQDVEHWTRRALDLAEPESPARAIGLIAKARHDPGTGGEAADEAVRLAERLGDPELRSSAYFAQRRIAALGHDYEALESWTDRTVEVLPAEHDPSDRANDQFVAAIDYLKLGRLAKARALVDEHGATAVKLSVHHRVHVVSAFVLEDTLLGRWTEAFERAPEVAETAGANLDTPCQFNWRSLAMCALAAEQYGDQRAARRLEEQARDFAAGAPEAHEPSFIRLALLRGDLEAVEELLNLAPPEGSVFDVDTPAARLDALVALGAREQVESEALGWVDVSSYTQPFALRALGVVRGDTTLVDRAAARFDEIGLAWRADETRGLASSTRGGRSRAKT